MATNYRGYLMKVNGEPVDQSLFQEYKSTPMKQSDLNPYTDAAGVTHREVLAHRRTEIVFTTPPICLDDKIKLQTYFPNRITVNLEYWNDYRSSNPLSASTVSMLLG